MKLILEIYVNIPPHYSLPCLTGTADYIHAVFFSTQTFLGVICRNENDTEGITSILKELHRYVPYVGKGHNREYADQAIVGDQHTVERGVYAHNTLSNGFTPKETLEGLHFECANWHGVNKALDVSKFALFIYINTACIMCSGANNYHAVNVDI
jgi:hypothetical protein